MDSAVRRLDGELSTFKFRVANVSASCGADVTGATVCERLRALRAKLAPDALRRYCETLMTSSDCEACLAKP